MLRAISCGVSSIIRARVNSGRSSVTSGPIIDAPRISPYFFLVELRGTDGRNVTRRSSADYDNIKIF
jgi:hypothetical protein